MQLMIGVFLIKKNGYAEKTKNAYLGIEELPDHAILKGMILIYVSLSMM